MADPAAPVDANAALVSALAAEIDAADDAAQADADAAKARLDSAWKVGYETWTIAGPPPDPAEPVKP